MPYRGRVCLYPGGKGLQRRAWWAEIEEIEEPSGGTDIPLLMIVPILSRQRVRSNCFQVQDTRHWTLSLQIRVSFRQNTGERETGAFDIRSNKESGNCVSVGHGLSLGGVF